MIHVNVALEPNMFSLCYVHDGGAQTLDKDVNTDRALVHENSQRFNSQQ